MTNQTDPDIYMQHEIIAHRTSQRWAALGLTLLTIVAAGALIWVIERYFGPDGVRIFLICTGIAAIVLLIYLLSIGVSAIYGRQAMAHHNNVLEGLIAFQRADDYGEVARSVATGMTGVLRSENQVEGRLLTLADRMARQQRQLTDNQHRSANIDADATWYAIPANAHFDDDIPSGWNA